MAKKIKTAKTVKAPQDLTNYALRGIRRRLARCEARLELLETAIAANPQVWKAFSKAVASR